jgi:hypothetical protein
MALLATGEQVRYIMDLAKKAEFDGDEAVSDALDAADAVTVHDLTREQASALIDLLKALLHWGGHAMRQVFIALVLLVCLLAWIAYVVATDAPERSTEGPDATSMGRER